MDTIIRLQDPDGESSSYLLEAILDASHNASEGTGMFAFASAKGVRMLFDDADFAAFLKRASFDLIVGVDAVTNVATLALLKEYTETYRKLVVRVFLHHRKGILFHPKFCWFRSLKGGTAVLGSGNLTLGGLAGNWEAFSLCGATTAEAQTTAAQWRKWTLSNKARLKSVDDEEVLARAAKNVAAAIPAVDSDDVALDDVSSTTAPDTVMIAEIPRGERWKQANFDLETFRQFFQATPGARQRVFLWHVAADGTVGDIEVRPCVSVKSQNYRIELGAAVNLSYPEGSARPIAVFLRSATRKFRYRLLMPEDPSYNHVLRILAQRWTGRTGRMRRVTMSSDELRRAWPDSPLLPEP
ncbi:phospholipase D family protein [Corallococcus sp. AS-1-12]|uniref:phospholipase D family protein n=1 Tax=Corallococcus sp. AS-1-12 TaxID=2874598 RepID=UPI001CBCF524|nr:phospholipase D family protein [Corallococcus sp. AS-1-12]MBZ4330523.1 phospholipase D family protein [Corallococcus sp. AS-1-12]